MWWQPDPDTALSRPHWSGVRQAILLGLSRGQCDSRPCAERPPAAGQASAAGMLAHKPCPSTGSQSHGLTMGEERRLPAWVREAPRSRADAESAHRIWVSFSISHRRRCGFRSLYAHPFPGPPLEVCRGPSQTRLTLGRAGRMRGRTGPRTSLELLPPLLRGTRSPNPESQQAPEVAEPCGHLPEPATPSRPGHSAQQGLQRRSGGAGLHGEGPGADLAARKPRGPSSSRQSSKSRDKHHRKRPQPHATQHNWVPSQRGSGGCRPMNQGLGLEPAKGICPRCGLIPVWGACRRPTTGVSLSPASPLLSEVNDTH